MQEIHPPFNAEDHNESATFRHRPSEPVVLSPRKPWAIAIAMIATREWASAMRTMPTFRRPLASAGCKEWTGGELRLMSRRCLTVAAFRAVICVKNRGRRRWCTSSHGYWKRPRLHHGSDLWRRDGLHSSQIAVELCKRWLCCETRVEQEESATGRNFDYGISDKIPFVVFRIVAESQNHYLCLEVLNLGCFWSIRKKNSVLHLPSRISLPYLDPNFASYFCWFWGSRSVQICLTTDDFFW